MRYSPRFLRRRQPSVALSPSAPAGSSLATPLDSTARWIVAVTTGALALYAISPFRDRFPATIAGTLAFAAVTLTVPATAIRRTRPVCPLNWFLLLFFLSIVCNPLLICFAGPYINTLPQLPADVAINVAELISVIAFLGFACGAELTRRRSPHRARPASRLTTTTPTRVAAVYAVLGVVGVALAFHSPHALASYFRQASGHVGLQQQEAVGVVTVASLVLRSFLQYAVVIPWAVWLDRRRPSGWRLWSVTLLTAAFVALSEATFSYNRGSIAAPLVAMTAALGARHVGFRISVLVALALVGFSVLAIARTYRNSPFTLSQALTSATARSYLLTHTSADRELQIYANAPQYLGYFLDREDYGAHPTYGRTILSSVLSPLPRLGIPFRNTSGPAVFNRQIYGSDSATRDQLVPFAAELFLDFTYPGVFVGFLLVGMLAMKLQRLFGRSDGTLRAFVVQYASIWSSFVLIGSVAVTSQQLMYFFWPALILIVLAYGGERLRVDAVSRSHDISQT
jgi:hypothetical protein